MNVSSFLTATTQSLSFANFSRYVNSSIAPWSRIILATSVTALIGLGVYRWSQSTPSRLREDDEDDNFNRVKARITRTYGYVFGGLALTALSAVVSHTSGLSAKILRNNWYAIPLVFISLGSLVTTLYVSKENEKVKHVAWTIFNVTMGISLSPLGFLNQAVVAQAAAISLGLGALLTLTAFLAPDRRFLEWEGPLMAALTGISIASSIAFFFPRSAFAYGVDRASLYGGLLIFSGLLMSSTQRLMEEAKTQREKDFDPINASMNIYLDSLNIFIRIVRILNENKDESERMA